MILGILVDAVWCLVASRAWIVAHAGCGHGVGIHTVLPDDENTRVNGLGAQHPGALTTDHGDDAIGDGEIHWAGAENIDQNPREPPPFIAGRFRIEFHRSAGGRLLISVMKHLLAIDVDTERRDAEEILDADG